MVSTTVFGDAFISYLKPYGLVSTPHRLPVFTASTMASKKGTGRSAKKSATMPTLPSSTQEVGSALQPGAVNTTAKPKPKPKPRAVQNPSLSHQQTSAGTITLPRIMSNKNTPVLANPANDEDTEPRLALSVTTQETNEPPQPRAMNNTANPKGVTSARQQTSTKTTALRQTGDDATALCAQLAAAQGKPFLLIIMIQLTFD